MTRRVDSSSAALWIRATWRALLLATLAPAALAARGQIPAVERISPAGASLAQVIDEMDVEHHWKAGEAVSWRTGRPDPRSSQHATHCSAFAAAACERLGVYLLGPPRHPQILLANAQYDWLLTKGSSQGWTRVGSHVEAQRLANAGVVVVCVSKNDDPGKPGHAAVVRPGTRPAVEVERDGPDTAMAGRVNRNRVPMRQAFQSHAEALAAGRVLMFAHASPVTERAAVVAARAARTAEPEAVPDREP